MITVSYNKKIMNLYFEVISKTNFFYISFVKWIIQRPRFCQIYKENKKERILDSVEYDFIMLKLHKID